MPKFEGISDRLNLQEALEKAVQKALSSISHPDKMISYSVKQISGRQGGIAGFNEVSVVIDAKVQ